MTRYLQPCIVLLVVLSSHALGAQTTAAPETPAAREGLVRRFVAAFNAHDPQAMAGMVTDDVEWLSVSGTAVATETVGKAALTAAMTAYFNGCATCRSTLASIAATQARATTVEVAVWQTPQGTRQQQAIAVYEFSGPLIRRVLHFPPEPADTVSACVTDLNYRAFDFWIGAWDVQPTGSTRGPIGTGATSLVERQLGGCVIEEHWLAPGAPGAGKSFNIYNRALARWEQFWVDATGRVTHFVGRFREDGNLYYEADQFGTINKVRMTFYPLGPDRVRQVGHVSADQGKTWTVTFDFTYVRKQ